MGMCHCRTHGPQGVIPVSPDLVEPESSRLIKRGVRVSCRYKGMQVAEVEVSEAFLARNNISLVDSTIDYVEPPPPWINDVRLVCYQCYLDSVAQMEK